MIKSVMWTCPNCRQRFKREHQHHSCNERTVDSFFEGKAPELKVLFDEFIAILREFGPVALHPTRSRIAFAGKIRFGAMKYVGRDFIDIALNFDRPFEDNLCFYRIGEVPGQSIFVHYLRLMRREDINEEVRAYMQLATRRGNS